MNSVKYNKYKKTILILGNGFIGEALSKKILNDGHRVKVFSHRKSNIPKVEYRCGDIQQIDQYIDFFEDVDVVIHTIHTTVPLNSMTNIYKDAKENILPSIKLLEILRTNDIKNVIFISSGGAIYGLPNTNPVKEEHKMSPISAYGTSKLCIENYINLYNYQYNLNISIIRPSNLYGVGQAIRRIQGLIPNIIRNAIKNEPVNIWGDGNGKKDYLYISDFINAITLMINNFPKNPKVYNLSSGNSYSIIDLISIIEKELNSSVKKIFLNKQNFDVYSIILDSEQFKKDYFWSPKVSIHEGIKKIIRSL